MKRLIQHPVIQAMDKSVLRLWEWRAKSGLREDVAMLV